MSILLFQNLQTSESNQINYIVASKSEQYRKVLQTRLDSLFREMDVAQHLYQNTDIADTKTFHIVAHPMVKRANGLVALEWIPRIARKELAHHQGIAKLNGMKNYFVKEKSLSTEFIAVNDRPYYYPVYLSEPKGSHVAIQGFDLGSNPERLSALTKAMKKNVTVATVPLTLLNSKLPYDGFLVFKPVYQSNTSIDTIEKRVKHLKGFIVGVFSIKHLIRSAFDFIDKPATMISLNDITEPISYTPTNSIIDNNSVYVRSTTISIADHLWKLTVKFPESTISFTSTFQPILALVIGVSITLFIIIYAYIVSANTRLINQKIIDKTSQQQKDDQLHRSLLNTISNAVISVNHKGLIESINPAGERIFGYQSFEVIGKHFNLFIPKPHDQQHEQYLSQYYRTGKSNIIGSKQNVKGLHKLGHEIMLELSIAELNSRNTPFFSFVIKDMSTQIETEKLTKRLVEITRISPDFIATFDAEGTVVFANDPARKALGCSEKDSINNYRLNNIFPSEANEFFQKSKRYPDYLHSWIGESIFVTAEGQATPVAQLLLSHPCNQNEIQYYTAFMRDITEDKNSQIENLKAKQLAEKMVETHSQRIIEILNNISIPASIIKLNAKYLLDSTLNNAQREQLTNIYDSERSIVSILQENLGYISHNKNSNTVIDLNILNRLKNSMSSKEYGDFLPRYVSDTEKNIQTMHHACENNHYQEVKHIAHEIKSSSANLGVSNLSHLADTLEHDIHEQQFEKIPVQISNIAAEFSIVKDHLHNENITHNKVG